MKLFLYFILIILIPTMWAFSLTPEEILSKIEENQTFSSFQGEGKMIIRDRFGARTKSFITYARGDEEALIEFTSLDEAGQKILRTEDEIYLYYPDAEEVIRLQGAALRDSVAGSDLSYEDLTGGKNFREKYNATLEGEEVINGNACYILVLYAKEKNVPYPKQKVWVDKRLFVARRAQYFALSGRLLKEVEVEEVQKIKEHYIPTHYIFRDVLKKNSSTEFIISNIKVDVQLMDNLFSLEGLSW